MTTPSGQGDPAAASHCAIWLVLLAAAVVAAYGGSFSCPLLYDDVGAIVGNPSLRHVGSAFWPPAGLTVSGRPVLNISLAIDYAISGTAVWSYHLTNLAIHVLACMTLFGLVRRAAALAMGERAPLVAFSSALLWAVHPLQTESVTYVIQRAESLMGLFYLLTLYCLARGATETGAGSRRWLTLSVASCLLGMGTKEVMATAPIVALLFDRTFIAGSFREAMRRRWPAYAGMAATWLVLSGLILSTHGRAGSAGFESGATWWGYALTQFPAIVHYLRLGLWPDTLVFDYGTALAPLTAWTLACAISVAALVAATVWALARRPLLGFLGASFFMILAPSSSIVPVATETMAEHRMYLPLIPLVVLAVMGIFRWTGRAALPLCVALAAVLSLGTWQRNKTYGSELGIWEDTVSKRPENDRAHYNLGCALDKARGRTDEAIAQYEEALRLRPANAEAHYNLGCDLGGVAGRLDDAIGHFTEAVRLRPDFAAAHFNLGFALDKAPGREREAIAQYREAIRLKPDFFDAHYALACDLERSPGEVDEAIAEYEEALRIEPGNPEVHYVLGRVLERIPGRLEQAALQFEEALRVRPDFYEAHYSLGNALMRSGRASDAIGHYQEAVRLKPDFPAAHCNLGNALASLGRFPEAIGQFEEALRFAPDDATFHYDLALALLRVPGGKHSAVEHLRRSIQVQPYDNPASRILNGLDGSGP